MNALEYCVGLLILAAIVTGILFVLFGQVTVRKLRKNPTAKNALGIEFVSGWDILNVASALSTPQWLREKLSASPLAAMSADYSVLREYISSLDRGLAIVFWYSYLFTGCSTILLLIANVIGAFPD